MARNTLATDTFTRADSSDLGANWDPYTSLDQGCILSNWMQPFSVANSSGFETYNATVAGNNQWASVQLITLNSTGGYVNVAVYARATAPNTFTGYLFAQQSDLVFLGKQVAGVFTSLASVSHTATAFETLSIECVGTGLEGFIDAGSILTTTDSDIAGGRAGIGWFADTGATTSDIVVDNFSMGDFTASDATVHRGLLLGVGI